MAGLARLSAASQFRAYGCAILVNAVSLDIGSSGVMHLRYIAEDVATEVLKTGLLVEQRFFRYMK